MATVALICGVLALVAGAIAAFPVFWRAVKVAARAPFIIEGMAREFSPNGGSSLRDGIDRLGHRLDAHVAESDRKHDETLREIADLRDAMRSEVSTTSEQ